GRIAPADDGDFLPVTEFRLEVCRSIVDAGALERLQALEGRLPVSRSRGEDDDAAADALAAVQFEFVERIAAVQSGQACRDFNSGAELLRLHEGPAGQRLPGDPRRKAQVVFDLGTRAGLPARCYRIHDNDIE